MILNYSTTMPVAKTMGEIQALLGEHGASAVAIRYDMGEPVGVSFTLPLAAGWGERAYTLPVDISAMHALLTRRHAAGQLKHGSRATNTSRMHAARVAWRVLKDWLEAQLAIVEANMAALDQIMLPYLLIDGHTSLYQRYQETGLPALEAAP